ncbi:MAG: hypothetical protein AB8B56_19940 [Crocinitomicaceae bacterium]
MKLHVFLICSLLISSLVSFSQDCPPFTADLAGRAQVNIESEEDCFKVMYRGRDLISADTRYATFRLNDGMHTIKIVMSDGTELSKRVMVDPDHGVLNYNIKKKKKGKYAVKLSLFGSQLTAEAQQTFHAEADENHRKNVETQKARQAASDKEWDDKLAKKEQEREERKAKEKAEQDKLDAERDAQWEAEKKETFSTENTSSTSNTSSSFSGIGGSGSSIEFIVQYESKPVCEWNITIAHADEDSEVVVASGETNSQGSFKSSYEGLLDVPFKVTGTRQGSNGEVKWSVDGFWYINEEEVKEGKIILDIKKFEDYMSNGGMSGMGGMAVSYARYGLTSHCD